MLYAARQLGRPVKWVGTRSEAFLADAHGRDQVSTVSLALAKDGTFLALKVETVGNLGAWCGTMGPFTPTQGTARTQGGPYAFPALLYTARTAFTNTAQTDPYRGAGRPEATFHVERIVEHAARTLGLDRVELRRRNLIRARRAALEDADGAVDRLGQLRRRCWSAPWSSPTTPASRSAPPRPRRAGCAAASRWRRTWRCTGGAPKEEAKVTFGADGRVTLAVGSHSTGMGHETVAARRSWRRGWACRSRRSTSSRPTPPSPRPAAATAARARMEVGGNAVLKAADEIVAKGRAIAAHLLNSRVEDIEHRRRGRFSDIKTGQSLTLAEVAAAAADASRLPPGMAAGALDTTAVYERAAITIPNGCHAAEVEVDPETGVVKVVGFWAVDDFGSHRQPDAGRRPGDGRGGAGPRPGAPGGDRLRPPTPASR